MTTIFWNNLPIWKCRRRRQQFDAQLHERVNRSLVAWQLVDLVVERPALGLLHFAAGAWSDWSLLRSRGRYESKPKNRRR